MHSNRFSHFKINVSHIGLHIGVFVEKLDTKDIITRVNMVIFSLSDHDHCSLLQGQRDPQSVQVLFESLGGIKIYRFDESHIYFISLC